MKTHLSINVSDIGRSVDFYTKMFGTPPVKVKADYAKFDIADPPLNFTMNESDVAAGGALSHLGLQVETGDEVRVTGRRWKGEGLETLEEIGTDCCYALQDKVWVADPDGNRWEVFNVIADTEGIAGSRCNTSSSCCSPAA
jgi:catechol 2,3-dioxygenase-like lactoylglutathione lyase family enzyme